LGKIIIPKEFLGAFKRGHRVASRDFIDEELATQLLMKVLKDGCEESRKVLEWLTRFNNEYYKAVIKKGDPEALHNTEQLRQDLNNRNYLRRNDLYTLVPLVRKLSGL
jgi:hypothetical protein